MELRARGRAGRSQNPFAALGLPPRANLTDDDVRAAWRRVATATHPDRADGGDAERFAAAAAAYTALRTPFGRGEALADLAATPGSRAVRRLAPRRLTLRRLAPSRLTLRLTVRRLTRRRPALGRLGSRVRRGRPLRLGLRAAVAGAVGTGAALAAGWQPATPAVITGVLTWLVLTARHDLAPPE